MQRATTTPIVLLGLIAGCSSEPPAANTAGSRTRDMLVVAYPGDIDSLNPVVSSSANDSAVADNLFYPTIDSDFDCSLKHKAGLAQAWSWSDDGKTLSMTLRDDLTWSDGVKVTASDLAFTYELLSDPLVATPRAGYVARLKPEARPKVIDATHVEWQFTEAYDRDSQIAHVSMTVLPRHVLEKVDRATLKGAPFSKAPTVNGPWKLAKYEPAQRFVLEPNEAFTGPAEQRPRLDRVVFKVIPEYATRLLELQNGTVDMMEGIAVADADKLRKDHPNLKLVRRGWRSMDYVGWNLMNSKFSDKRVRKALALAVDVNDMIAKLLTSDSGETYGRPAIGTITPELCGVHNDAVHPLTRDLSEAKRLLAEAGWTDTNGDGIIDKDGQAFQFSLLTNTENKRRADAAIFLQSHLKDVGVRMNIEKLDFNTMTDRMKRRDFEAVLSGWSAALFIDPSNIWHSDPPGRKSEFNYVSYSNPAVDDLIARGLATPKPEEAAPIWKELQATIYEDQPYLFLWWMDEIIALDSRFSTHHINLLSRLYHLNEWEVAPDKVKYRR
jgi:peptide/nickel transport system substrate-binding protein